MQYFSLVCLKAQKELTRHQRFANSFSMTIDQTTCMVVYFVPPICAGIQCVLFFLQQHGFAFVHSCCLVCPPAGGYPVKMTCTFFGDACFLHSEKKEELTKKKNQCESDSSFHFAFLCSGYFVSAGNIPATETLQLKSSPTQQHKDDPMDRPEIRAGNGNSNSVFRGSLVSCTECGGYEMVEFV